MHTFLVYRARGGVLKYDRFKFDMPSRFEHWPRGDEGTASRSVFDCLHLAMDHPSPQGYTLHGARPCYPMMALRIAAMLWETRLHRWV